MNLIQFKNNLGEALEQGDVVLIGEKQLSPYYGANKILTPEVDSAQRAYDTRVCGIVFEVYAELKAEVGDRTNGEGGHPKAKRKSAAKSVRLHSIQLQSFTHEELAAIDR